MKEVIAREELENNTFESVYTLDTNIILDSYNNIFMLSDGGSNHIVVPLQVIKELDRIKTDMVNTRGNEARQFSRLLSEGEVTDQVNTDDYNLVDYMLEGNVSLTVLDPKGIKADNADEVIIETAVKTEAIYGTEADECVFVTNDNNCRIIALSKGLETEFLREGYYSDEEKEYYKELLDIDNAGKLLNTEVSLVDKDYNLYNFNYKVVDKDGKPYFYFARNGRFTELLDFDTMFRRLIVKPKGVSQSFFVASILLGNDITISDSKAGSAKTVGSLLGAMAYIMENDLKDYKIYYTRTPVRATSSREQETGFYKGSLEEKLAFTMLPMSDSIDFLNSNNPKYINSIYSDYSIEDKRFEFMKEWNIEMLPMEQLRGRSLSDAIIIVDECQNMSVADTQLVISRANETCKLIFIGSNYQVDSSVVNKFNNSLSRIKSVAETYTGEVKMHCITLTKILRGKFAEFADNDLINSLGK